MTASDAPRPTREIPGTNLQFNPPGEGGLGLIGILSPAEIAATATGHPHEGAPGNIDRIRQVVALPLSDRQAEYSYTPGNAGFLAGVQDWTDVDLRQQYGFRKTANGFTADNIPGPDGTRYGIDIDRSGTRQPPEQVWRIDQSGNRVAVSDPEIIRQVADAGNKMFDVWAARNVLEELGLSDAETQYVNRFMDAVSAQDAGAIQRLVSEYSGSRDRFGDLFVAMFCQQALRNMDNYHIGLLHLGDHARLLVRFPGQREMTFDLR